MGALTVKKCLNMRTLARTGLTREWWCVWTWKRFARVLGGKDRRFDICEPVCLALTACDTRVRAQRAVVRQSVSARDCKRCRRESQDLGRVRFVTLFQVEIGWRVWES